jgi:hypothetical protein
MESPGLPPAKRSAFDLQADVSAPSDIAEGAVMCRRPAGVLAEVDYSRVADRRPVEQGAGIDVTNEPSGCGPGGFAVSASPR